ncbi:MAG: hypothetical protein KAH22_08555 [Thiotrichaceae bacterium]|nr:hypothetical protein [Thiotrichaceae bacterium]
MRQLIILFLLMITLSGCGNNTPTEPKAVAQAFWTAIQEGKMDSAKQLISWDTTGYLKYIHPDRFSLKRFSFEATGSESNKIPTSLVLAGKKNHSDIRIPTHTILKYTEGVWRVDLKQTLVQVINRSANKMGEELNKLLQQGVSELNGVLNESVNELSRSLEEGAQGVSHILQESISDVESSFQQIQQNLGGEKLPDR